MINRRGFSLVSVVAAAAILGIALTIAVSAFYSGSRLNKQAESYLQVSNFIEGVMEQVRSEPYERIATTDIEAGLPKLPEAKCRLEVTSAEPGLKQVTVRFNWLAGKMHRETKLSTLIAKGGSR